MREFVDDTFKLKNLLYLNREHVPLQIYKKNSIILMYPGYARTHQNKLFIKVKIFKMFELNCSYKECARIKTTFS